MIALKEFHNPTPDLINFPNLQGNTSLMFACEHNHFVMLKALIELQGDVTVQNHNRETLLTFAIRNNNYHLVLYLIEVKVDVNRQTREGDTPLYAACKRNDQEMVTPCKGRFFVSFYLEDEIFIRKI